LLFSATVVSRLRLQRYIKFLNSQRILGKNYKK